MRILPPFGFLAGLLLVSACDGVTDPDSGDPSSNGGDGSIALFDLASCVLDPSALQVDTGWDQIRAIDDPRFIRADRSPVDHVSSDARIIGFEVGGEAYAVPRILLFSHEVLNLDRDISLAITYCPLTGSSLAFRRDVFGGARMGVSGLLLHNNLVLFDRSQGQSLWSQMGARGICGVRGGVQLPAWPVIEMRWESWRRLHPDTWVLAPEDRSSAPEAGSPHASSGSGLTDGDPVLGVPSPIPDRSVQPGIAFPRASLRDLPGARQVVAFSLGGEPRVVLWSDEADGGMAYDVRTDSGIELDLAPAEDEGGNGRFVDRITGSEFTVDGRAVSGPLEGERLRPVAGAYMAFRVPWLAFHPDSRIWAP